MADGTVELDNAPRLPAGRVEIVLRPLSPAGQEGEDWWQYLQRVRREAETAGGPFLSQEEIDEERGDFRGVDEQIDIIRR
jgi:hypothetical protein